MIRLLKTPSNKRKFVVFVGDVIIMAAIMSFLVFFHAFLVRYTVVRNIARPFKPYALYICPLVHVLISYIFEAYAIRKREKLRTLVSLSIISFLSFCLLFSLAKVIRINQTTMIYIFAFFVISPSALYLWRSVCRKVLLLSRKFIKERVLFIGTDVITEDLLDVMKSHDYKVLGLLTEYESQSLDKPRNLRHLGLWNMLQSIVDKRKVDSIVTAENIYLPLEIMKAIYRNKMRGVIVHNSAYFYEIITRRVAIKYHLKSDRIPYFDLDAFSKPMARQTKRIVDCVAAILLFVLVSPVFAAIMILIKLTSKGSIFFIQRRIGFQEEPFNLIKFRTMIVNAEKENEPQWSKENDSRVTAAGRFLRRTRLDELPQLINICKGDMSFIGPRPIRQHFARIIEETMPFYSLRFTIKPGLTGWAQVNYDYGGTIEGHIEKFQHDLYYIKHASLFLDLLIILKTIQTVLLRPSQ